MRKKIYNQDQNLPFSRRRRRVVVRVGKFSTFSLAPRDL